MTRACFQVPASLTIQEQVDDYILAGGYRCLVLIQDTGPVGLMTLADISQVPREHLMTTPVRDVITPMEQVQYTSPKTGLDQALEQMGADGVKQMPVVENGQIEGMLSRDDILNYRHLLQKIGK
jgi:CBS domain-containing protein